MQSASDLLGLAGGKPKLITRLTSGTGTYVPTADMARCLVRIQAGGGGGSTQNAGTGGGGGAMIEVLVRVPIAGLAYAVGAGGAAEVKGSVSYFGNYRALPGLSYDSGVYASVAYSGGMLEHIVGSVDTDSASMLIGRGPAGVSGGGGGIPSVAGRLVGFPVSPASNLHLSSASLGYADASNAAGVKSGGDSFYGTGGAAGSAPAAGNYGAGGGGHASTPGAGLGGCIEIWDFGA